MIGPHEYAVGNNAGRIARMQLQAELRRLAGQGQRQSNISGRAVDAVDVEVGVRGSLFKRDTTRECRDDAGSQNRGRQQQPLDHQSVDREVKRQVRRLKKFGKRG